LTPDAVQELKLAQRLAEGDATAATAMLALQTLENGRVSAIHHREVAAARASLKRASLGNNRFSKELKSLVLRALVATGAIESAAIPSMLQHISVEHAARLLARSSHKVDSVTDPVLQETIRNARAIASGDLDAARNLVADARIAARGSEMLPDAEKKLLETRFNHVSLKDSSFNHKVRRSLLKMLQKSGLIVDASAAQWQKIDAQSAAKMLASTAQLKPEQLNLVKRIANGDAAAAKLVLAQSNFEDQLQRAEQSLDGVSLQDNGFRHNLKGVLLQALRRSGETGARLAARNMNSTVEGVAAVLQDTADASSTKSLIVGQAAVLSSRIAKADLSAAKQLVARQAVLQKLRANAQVHSYRRELDRMRTRPCNDTAFTNNVRQLLLRGLRASGVDTSKMHVMNNSSTADLARWLQQVKPEATHSQDAALSAAVRLAPAIAMNDCDAAKKLVSLDRLAHSQVSREAAHLKGSKLSTSSFNAVTKAALLKTLVRTGIIDSAASSSWHNLDAQDAAKLLLSAHLRAKDSTDPLSAAAIRLASRIAQGENNAAQQLVAQNRAVHKQMELMQRVLEPKHSVSSASSAHVRNPGLFNATVAIYGHQPLKSSGSRIFPATVSIFPQDKQHNGMHDEQAKVQRHGRVYEVQDSRGRVTAVIHPEPQAPRER